MHHNVYLVLGASVATADHKIYLRSALRQPYDRNLMAHEDAPRSYDRKLETRQTSANQHIS